MKLRPRYAGALSLVLAAGCSPTVEIGHGDGMGGTDANPSGSSAGAPSVAGTGVDVPLVSGGESSTGGQPAKEPTGGSTSSAGTASTTAGTGGAIAVDPHLKAGPFKL